MLYIASKLVPLCSAYQTQQLFLFPYFAGICFTKVSLFDHVSYSLSDQQCWQYGSDEEILTWSDMLTLSTFMPETRNHVSLAQPWALNTALPGLFGYRLKLWYWVVFCHSWLEWIKYNKFVRCIFLWSTKVQTTRRLIRHHIEKDTNVPILEVLH